MEHNRELIQVKVLDEEHEDDLTDSVNSFLATLAPAQLITIHYSTSHFSSGEEQIYSFSAMIIYRIE